MSARQHARGDVELIAGNVKLHAHRDVLASGSPGLAKLMELRPVVSALKRQPDLVKHAARVHPILGQVFAVLVTVAHFVAVVVTFAASQISAPWRAAGAAAGAPVLVRLLRRAHAEQAAAAAAAGTPVFQP